MWSSRAKGRGLAWRVALVAGLAGVTSASGARADAVPAATTGLASTPVPATTGPAATPVSATTTTPSHPLSPEVEQLEKAPPTTGRPMVWIGATIFTLSYIAAALVATTSYPSSTDITTPHGSLWIPFVGPFIDMAHTSGAADIVLLALDGAAQIGGFTLFVYGQTVPKTSMPDGNQAPAVTIRVAPVVGPGTGGASVFARF
jgi:hypothetical protein